MSTLTVYPDPNPESTTGDGSLHNDDAAADWAGIRDDTACTSVFPSDAQLHAARIESDATGLLYPTMTRSIFLWDITGVPAGATFTAGAHTVSFFAKVIQDTFGSQSLSLVGSTPATNTDIVVGDYDQLDTTKRATDITFAALTDEAYNDFTGNSTLDSDISTAYAGSKIVKLGLRVASDVANSAPSGASKVVGFQCSSADEALTTQDPKLVLAYTTTLIKTILGVTEANTKTFNGVTNANMKTFNGVS